MQTFGLYEFLFLQFAIGLTPGTPHHLLATNNVLVLQLLLYLGSIVRVAPAGKRALKNTGEGEMLMLCIQYKANSFGVDDSPAGDGVILGDKLTW